MKLTREEILEYCALYDAKTNLVTDQAVADELFSWFTSHRYLDRDTLIKVGVWKSPRATKRYKDALNSEARVRELTTFALGSNDEFIRVMTLQILKGVSWGVASSILHFAFPDEYMILDFRAVWSLGIPLPKQYSFEFWLKYSEIVREHAREMNITLRDLDKALWQYSKEHQIPSEVGNLE